MLYASCTTVTSVTLGYMSHVLVQ